MKASIYSIVTYTVICLYYLITPYTAESQVQSKEWTIMIFMNGDNNLEAHAIDDMNEMERIGSDDAVNIVVQIDRTPRYDTSNDDWKGTRRYYIEKDNKERHISSKPLEWPRCKTNRSVCASNKTEVEIDMGDYNELADFMEWSMDKYPAKKYALVLWGHGEGWKKAGISPHKGLARDDSSRGDSHISTIELATVLDGLYDEKKLDLLVFDACSMQMIEVAYQYKDYFEFMVGSTDEVPPDGLPYDTIIGNLVQEPSIDASALGRLMVSEYHKHYVSDHMAITYSLLGSDDLEQLIMTMAHFHRLLYFAVNTPSGRQKVHKVYSQTQPYLGPSGHDFLDLVHFLKLIGSNFQGEIQWKAEESIKVLEESIIIDSLKHGDNFKNSFGLSFYFPSCINYTSEHNSLYEKLSFSKQSHWGSVLGLFHFECHSPPPFDNSLLDNSLDKLPLNFGSFNNIF